LAEDVCVLDVLAVGDSEETMDREEELLAVQESTIDRVPVCECVPLKLEVRESARVDVFTSVRVLEDVTERIPVTVLVMYRDMDREGVCVCEIILVFVYTGVLVCVRS
jgi:hypothetical protein